MKSESDPITPDEWLLRRVHIHRFTPSRGCPISPNAFEPRYKGNDPDTDGISLYRQACLRSLEDLLQTIDPEKRDNVGIVRLQVSDLWNLQLTVKPAPVAAVPGHVVIPELNAAAYRASKARYAGLKQRLAELASRQIVRRPPLLDSDAPSRPS